ncbi:hypothetical protein EV401DRAFT_1888694 [Pisolithus croceorrhizus]|nr:hypothetical protein EV401DRAFT_1888694 [Pisolithus croceorrhizus]
MPPNVTLITAYDPTSTCVATSHSSTSAYATVPVFPSTERQSRGYVQAYTPTPNTGDPLLASGMSNLAVGLPMAYYGDASHSISHTSNFDLSALMAFNFPALSIVETDIGLMVYRNTNFGAPVQWSLSSAYSMPQVPMPASNPIAVLPRREFHIMSLVFDVSYVVAGSNTHRWQLGVAFYIFAAKLGTKMAGDKTELLQHGWWEGNVTPPAYWIIAMWTAGDKTELQCG